MKTSRWTALLQNQAVALVLLMLFAVPALFGAPAAQRGDQLLAYGFLGLGLAAVWALRSQGKLTWERVRTYALSGPNLAIAGYAVWCGVSAALSPEPFYARWAMIQIVCGVVLYGLVTYQFRQREQVKALLVGVLSLAVIAVMSAMALDGKNGLTNLAGSFRDRQLFGAFLTIMFPVTLGVAAGSRNRVWKVGAQIASVLVLGALLCTSCRSSWLGTIAGASVFFALGLGYAWKLGKLSSRKHELILTPALGIVALTIFLSFSGITGQVMQRIGTISSVAKVQQDDSVRDRAMLRGNALQLASRNPIFGFGPGSYPVKQAELPGAARPEMLVRAMGTSLFDNPHNLYVNLAAEVGYVGLALYLAILACFFTTALRALPRLENGLRKFTLIGSVASVTALSVDAFANPGYVFPEITFLFWVVLGIGMCAAGLGQRIPDEPRSDSDKGEPNKVLSFVGRGIRTAAVGCGALWVGALLWSLHTASAAAAGGPPTPGGGSGGGRGTPTYAGVMTDLEVDILGDGIDPEAAFNVNSGTTYCDRKLYFHVYAIADQDDQNANVTFEKKSFKFKLLDGLKGKIGFTKEGNNPRFFFLAAKAGCGRSGRIEVSYPKKGPYGPFSAEFQVNVLGDAPFYVP